MEAVSRRVGELVSEQVWGRGPAGAPDALNELDPYPRPPTPPAPMRRDTRALVIHHASWDRSVRTSHVGPADGSLSVIMLSASR